MRRAVLLLVALLAAAAVVTAAPPEAGDDVWSLIAVPRDAGAVAALGTLDADVEGGTPSRLHALVRPADVTLLEEQGIPVVVLAADTQALRPVFEPEGRGPAYHEPGGVQWSLRALAEQYPEVARSVDVGLSVEGRPLAGLLLTDNPSVREDDEPSLRLLGTHHGDEWSSMEVPLDVAWSLTEAYAAGDERARGLLDHNELWIVPVVNPDGVVAFTRRNARNVDLNRNYAYEWSTAGASGEHPFSEPEVAAMRALGTVRSFSHSLTLHSGATNLGWVWNWTEDEAPDHDFMEALATTYLENTTHPDFWITQGGDWYVTRGDTNDWSYGARGGHDYTLELTLEKTPPAEEIDAFLAHHTWPSIDFLIDGSLTGLRGRVTGPDGVGVEAELAVAETPWPFFSDPETGAFARPLAPGDYTLSADAEGFVEQLLAVTVGAEGATVVDVVLAPDSEAAIDEVADLEVRLPDGGEPVVCGEAAEDMADRAGAEVALVRAGLDPVPVPFAAKGGCVVLDLQPAALDLDRWLLEGEWTLLLGDRALALGILVAADDPGYVANDLEVSEADDAGRFRLDVVGENLPEGAMIRLVGPSGERVSGERHADDDEDRIGATFGVGLLSDGIWTVRVFGRGHHAFARDRLVVEGGDVWVDEYEEEEDPTEEPTEEPTGELPDDDDTGATDDDDSVGPGGLSGTGCTCQASDGGGGGGLPALLALLSLGRYTRRPRT